METPVRETDLPPVVISGPPKTGGLRDRLLELLPEGGNLNLCLTCGLCSAGCPATGGEDMDPRKFLRLVSLGQEDEAARSPWVWQCTMCQRCIYACPMSINIPQLIYYARESWPRDERPKGIRGSCDQALKTPTNSAMGVRPDDFTFVVEDILDEVRETQDACKDMEISINREGAEYFLNQNSREPATEPDEMVPLWKILKTVGCDWTYSDVGWAAENYCMFLSDDKAWEDVVRNKVEAVERLGCRYWLNTE
ncbi:MAG: hypothetical protein PWQ57_529 [Desulfovibrionales bacterium]|jgi:ferredoxin|nr:hypothetical protein [Desulfovibrionales bacterium]